MRQAASELQWIRAVERDGEIMVNYGSLGRVEWIGKGLNAGRLDGETGTGSMKSRKPRSVKA